MPHLPARSAADPAQPLFTRPSTRACLLALGGMLTAATAGPAMGIVYLDPKHSPFAITKANTGVAKSVVSLEFRYQGVDDVPDTPGGFRREGQASGVLLDSGQNNVFMITAAHNLAVLGRFDEDEDSSFFPLLNVGFGGNYNTVNTEFVDSWYVSGGAGDGAGVIDSQDFGIVKLNLTPDQLSDFGLTTVPIYQRDTPQQVVEEVQGETVEIVGFGQSGNGASGALNFTGDRRWGQNRAEPWLSSTPRLSPLGNAEFLEMDFDVDRDDDLYDNTPNNPFDINLARENVYAVKNSGQLAVSGPGSDPRQVPEEDFRVPFESGIAPGDSGGGVFLGGSLVGLPLSSRAIPLDTDGDGDDDDVGFGYGTDAQFNILSGFAEEIVDLIFFVEQAEIDFNNGERDSPDLTDNEAAALGFRYGAFDLNPLYNFEDQVETNDRRGNAAPPTPITAGAGDDDTSDFGVSLQVQKSILLTSYHSGEELSPVSKAKLIGVLPFTASDSMSDQELVDTINDAELVTIEAIEDALDGDLAIIYGEPALGRAIRAAQSLDVVPVNDNVPIRSAAPSYDLNQRGDYNGSGAFDADDIDAFIAEVEAEGEFTDLNGDGVSDDLDTAAYVESFLGLKMGDANVDGSIDQADLNAVLLNWGRADAKWSEGSFGGEDVVGQYDLNAVLINWGSSSAPSFEGFAVPEPAALTLLGLGGLAMLRRRGV